MRIALLVAVFLSQASPVLSQAVLRGRAIDDSSKAGIAGAEVVIEGTALTARSDAQGRFLISGLPPKIGTAVVRKVGFRPVRVRLLIFSERDTLNIEARLVPAAVELAPLEVVASAVPIGMEAFAERRAMGTGTFVDSKALREAEHRRVSELLARIPGVKLAIQNDGSMVISSSRGRLANPVSSQSRRNPAAQGRVANCPMAVWLDGMQVYNPGVSGGEPPDINSYGISQLEAIEVYSSAQLPSQLRGGSAACGAIVLWSRR